MLFPGFFDITATCIVMLKLIETWRISDILIENEPCSMMLVVGAACEA
jgi:hypothetical protein